MSSKFKKQKHFNAKRVSRKLIHYRARRKERAEQTYVSATSAPGSTDARQ